MQPVFATIVDFAGLFPPASSGMDEAVRQYAAYRGGPDGWMLGRFVVAAGRLEELGAAVIAQDVVPDSARPWGLSVVLGAHLPQEVGRLAAFRDTHAEHGLVIEAVEARVGSAGEAEVVAAQLDGWGERFLEVPHLSSYGDLVQAISRAGAFAKIRTGGTTPDAFPTPLELTRFLLAVVRARLPFKATAGLHHPWRGTYRLTYAPDAAQHVMYGFVNLLVATAALRDGADGEVAQAILEEGEPAAFALTDGGIRWRDLAFSREALEATRLEGFRGFGSCSFREPVDELALGVDA